MSFTKVVPNIPLEKAKHTKIIATVGPASNSYESILRMIKSGVNGIRLNFSHGNNEDRLQQIAWIRKASQEYNKPVAIIQDLQGPKLRVGMMQNDGVFLIPGEKIILTTKECSGTAEKLYINYKQKKILMNLQCNEKIYLVFSI